MLLAAFDKRNPYFEVFEHDDFSILLKYTEYLSALHKSARSRMDLDVNSRSDVKRFSDSRCNCLLRMSDLGCCHRDYTLSLSVWEKRYIPGRTVKRPTFRPVTEILSDKLKAFK